jgi:hypothetical protein
MAGLHLTDPHLPIVGKAFAPAHRMLDASEGRSALSNETGIEDWPWSSAGAGQRPTPQGFDG